MVSEWSEWNKNVSPIKPGTKKAFLRLRKEQEWPFSNSFVANDHILPDNIEGREVYYFYSLILDIQQKAHLLDWELGRRGNNNWPH